MLRLIAYPAIMLMALSNMGPIEYPLVSSSNISPKSSLEKISSHSPVSEVTNYYQQWQLESKGISEEAFNYAMKGFDYLNKLNLITQKNIITIVDFSKPSTQKRLYVIDTNTGTILFNTWVAHGRNSGEAYANQFSNLPESHQSSLGFYTTMQTYKGSHGYSLRLKGCEPGINDKAFERAIVIHGADYVSDRFISSRGALGRSYGCPAIPTEVCKKIIDVIKEGSCLFLYHPTMKYCTQSKILNSRI